MIFIKQTLFPSFVEQPIIVVSKLCDILSLIVIEKFMHSHICYFYTSQLQ